MRWRKEKPSRKRLAEPSTVGGPSPPVGSQKGAGQTPHPHGFLSGLMDRFPEARAALTQSRLLSTDEARLRDCRSSNQGLGRGQAGGAHPRVGIINTHS